MTTDPLPKSLHYLREDRPEDAFHKGETVAKWDGPDGVIRPAPFIYNKRQRAQWLKGYRAARRALTAAKPAQ